MSLLGDADIVYTGMIEYGERFGYFVELANAEAVRQLSPDFRLLKDLPARNLLVTAKGDDGTHDFVSRMFVSQGGYEDPVTGSTHCRLSPYWSEKLGKNELVGYQASARGGVVRTILDGDRITLGGQAATVMKGQLL